MKRKLVSVLIGVAWIAVILGIMWKTLGNGFILIGKLMTGDHAKLTFGGWCLAIFCFLLLAGVIAFICFLVHLIIVMIKTPDNGDK